MIKIFSVIFLMSGAAFGTSFPDSNFKIPKNSKMLKSIGATTGLNELEFHQAIDTFERVWAPIVAAKYEKKLILKRDWESEKVNAHATRDDDNNPVIIVDGGLARHSQITKDGLMLMICHELGHHLGGAPKIFRGNTTLRTWSSVEGQADYFASSKCMPRIFETQMEKSFFYLPEEAEQKISKICMKEYCGRIVAAAVSVGKVMASLRNGVSSPVVDKIDNSVVAKTVQSHSNPQCRFDTFLAGYNCEEDSSLDFDNEDPAVGACVHGEYQARPKCWYSSQNY